MEVFTKRQSETHPEDMREIRERMLTSRVPAVIGMVSLFIAGLAMMHLADTNPKVEFSGFMVWLTLFLVMMPVLTWTLHSGFVKLGQHRRLYGNVAAGVEGAFFGIASSMFMVGLPEAGLLAMLVFLVLASFAGLLVHSLFRSRFLIFIAFAWVPFLYRLTFTDVTVSRYFLSSLGISVVAIFLITLAVTGWIDATVAAQAARDQSAKELREQQSELKRAHLEQHIFFLAANHDIRQPMQAVSFYSFALGSRIPEEDVDGRDMINKLEVSIKMLGHIIDETLRFAKIAAGEEKAHTTVFRVKTIVEKLRADYGGVARQKKIALRVRDSDKVLFTDLAILERVLANLVSNAIRYTETGGVLVGFRKRGNFCQIQVWDSGIGIPEEDQARVFDSFYQGGNRKGGETGFQGGYGLGLTIVQRLCEQIGTSLQLSSVVGQGTCVSLSVPLASAADLPVEALALDDRTNLDLSGLTIAIVEDDAPILESMASILSGVGANVVAAAGLDTLQAQLKAYSEVHFLVADLHIAGLMGTDAVALMRQRYPQMEAVIVTGDASEATLRGLRRRGFNVVSKPIQPKILITMIMDAASRRFRVSRTA